jgi:hypothetical protein
MGDWNFLDKPQFDFLRKILMDASNATTPEEAISKLTNSLDDENLNLKNRITTIMTNTTLTDAQRAVLIKEYVESYNKGLNSYNTFTPKDTLALLLSDNKDIPIRLLLNEGCRKDVQDELIRKMDMKRTNKPNLILDLLLAKNNKDFFKLPPCEQWRYAERDPSTGNWFPDATNYMDWDRRCSNKLPFKPV